MGIGAIHARQAPAVRVLKVVKWHEALARCDAVGVHGGQTLAARRRGDSRPAAADAPAVPGRLVLMGAVATSAGI